MGQPASTPSDWTQPRLDEAAVSDRQPVRPMTWQQFAARLAAIETSRPGPETIEAVYGLRRAILGVRCSQQVERSVLTADLDGLIADARAAQAYGSDFQPWLAERFGPTKQRSATERDRDRGER